MIKKLLFSLFGLSLFIAPFSTHALTPLPNPNQAQINELLRQIALLQEQIRLLQAGKPDQWCHTFNTNLGVGVNSRDVLELHIALVKNRSDETGEGEGGIVRPQNPSQLFSEATAAAVSDFQLKYKNEILTPNGFASPTGYVGPATRRVLNRLYACRPVTSNQSPVISRVSGHTTLRVGETGTWTVQASDPENGPLSYSVVWGDEPENIPLAATPSATGRVQQTATFTHTYARAGTYLPTFAVTDNLGQKNEARISVMVGQNSNSPITITSPNGGEQWVANSVKPITWRYDGATSATKVNLYLQMTSCVAGQTTCLAIYHGPIVLDGNIPVLSSYNWIVATDMVNNPISPGNYVVWVCPADSAADGFAPGPDLTNCDKSDQPFTIIAQ